MHAIDQRPHLGAFGIGVALVAVGALAFAVRLLGFDLIGAVGEGGWPWLVIVPGAVLIGLAFVPAPPRGLGFAIAGSIVTTVGFLLLFQETTGLWASWSYAWALIPAAAGLAMTVYGSAAKVAGLRTSGLWVAGVAGALFLAGMWFFETVYSSGRAPIDLATWWPLGLVVAGIGVTIASRRTRSREG
jgi:hypothetical protein